MNLPGKVAILFAAILAALSVAALVVTGQNYVQGMSSAGNVKIELLELGFPTSQPDELRAVFRIVNRSPDTLGLDKFYDVVYLNGEFMGSDYTPFSRKVLTGSREIRLESAFQLQPLYLERLERARAAGKMSWSVRGRAQVVLPYRDRAIWLNFRQQWSGK